MRVCYLSGPISGVKNAEDIFKKAEEFLIREGMYDKVVNPFDIYHDLKDKIGVEPSYEDIMEYDLRALEKCSDIALMFGWEKSKGARIELRKAIDKELQVRLI